MFLKTILPTLVLAFLVTGTALAGTPVPEAPDDVNSTFTSSLATSGKLDYSSREPSVEAGMAPAADRYGYIFNDSLSPSWKDLITGGTEVDFSTRDDDTFGPVSLGFEFKFYENAYTEFYISTNGLLTFGEESDQFVNQAMPRDTFPDDFVTPFWDDLIMLVDSNGQKISKVFYQTGNDANGKYAAVEWYQFARLGSQDLLTFEAILYEDGSILFQYHDLNGTVDQATVGIEDEHGVDGLLYLHNAPGLSSSKAILISRPAASWRSKVYPVYRSAFTTHRRSTLDFTVRNTGDRGSDHYNLSLSAVPAGWQVSLYAGDGKTLLKDNDGDQVVDTGALAVHADFKVVVKIFAPEGALVGDFIRFSITAASSHQPANTAAVQIQTAVPAAFTQAAFDPSEGPSIKLLWKENQRGTNLSLGRQFTGSNLSVIALPDKRYVYTWEYNWRNEDLEFTYTNLEYTILSRFGTVLKPTAELTNNDAANVKTEDRFLSLSGTQDGRIGAIWVRSLTKNFDENGNPKSNYNVYFSVLDSSGAILTSAINLTQNQEWRGQNDYDVPVYIAPRIVATGDNRFVLAWGDERNYAVGSSADLFYAIMDRDGNTLLPTQAMTSSQPGEVRYSTPALIALDGNRVLMAYALIDPGEPDDPEDDVINTAYAGINSSGSIVKSQTVVNGSSGSTPDGIQFPTGEILLTWSISNAKVEYVVLNNDLSIASGGLRRLDEPKGRETGAVSVTPDGFGHAVLSWGEREQSDYLCYSLIGSQGEVLTPPMIFVTGLGDEPLINTNSFGLGNAAYDGSWQLSLPSINNNQ